MKQGLPILLAGAFWILGVAAATADEAAERLVLATFKVANDASTASSVVVQQAQADGSLKRYVITADHVFSQMAGPVCVLVGRERNEGGVYLRKEILIPIREGGRSLWRKHPHQDLAVLALPDNIEVAALPLESIVSEAKLAEIHAGDQVRMAVFPERSEANDAGFAILRGGSIASFPLQPLQAYPSFLVDSNSWTGDSGGPVMHAELQTDGGDPLVIGIVRGMRNVTDTTRESRFVEKRTHYPLGISEIIQAAFIHDLLPPVTEEPQP